MGTEERNFEVKIELQRLKQDEDFVWKAKLIVGQDYQFGMGHSWKEALTNLLANFKD